MGFLETLVVTVAVSSFFCWNTNPLRINNQPNEQYSGGQYRNQDMYYETPDFQNRELYSQSYVVDPLISGGETDDNANEDDTFVRNDNFRLAYFRNLKNNMPRIDLESAVTPESRCLFLFLIHTGLTYSSMRNMSLCHQLFLQTESQTHPLLNLLVF